MRSSNAPPTSRPHQPRASDRPQGAWCSFLECSEQNATLPRAYCDSRLKFEAEHAACIRGCISRRGEPMIRSGCFQVCCLIWQRAWVRSHLRARICIHLRGTCPLPCLILIACSGRSLCYTTACKHSLERASSQKEPSLFCFFRAWRTQAQDMVAAYSAVCFFNVLWGAGFFRLFFRVFSVFRFFGVFGFSAP